MSYGLAHGKSEKGLCIRFLPGLTGGTVGSEPGIHRNER